MRSITVLSACLVVFATPLLGCGQVNDRAGEETMVDRSIQEPANRLTPEEEAAGWKLLFDGTLDGWRGYRREDVPGGWDARDGALVFTPGRGGGTLITVDRYADFELALEWRVGEGGNSGSSSVPPRTKSPPTGPVPRCRCSTTMATRTGGGPRPRPDPTTGFTRRRKM